MEKKAARGTDARTYPWGRGAEIDFLNYNFSVGNTSKVGSYEMDKSIYGVYDMAFGNVQEWVNSLYIPYPYDANDGREVMNNTGDARVFRGVWWEQMMTQFVL